MKDPGYIDIVNLNFYPYIYIMKAYDIEKEALKELKVFIDDFKDNVEGISIAADVEKVSPGRDPRIGVTILDKRIRMAFYRLELGVVQNIDLDKVNENMNLLKDIVENSTNFAKRCSECFVLTSFKLMSDYSVHINLTYKS